MAQRLATEYKLVCLTLTKEQLTQFIRSFKLQKALIEENVLDSGDYEITLRDHDKEIHLFFEKCEEGYQLKGQCTFKDKVLAELMRKAMTTYKGNAIMHRIFSSFKVAYEYDHGTVKSIREINASEERLIFENRDISRLLEQILVNTNAEFEIEELRKNVDQLLDLRNQSTNQYPEIEEIDKKLINLAKRLNLLEA